MCGRYAASRRPEDLVEAFEVEATEGNGPGADPGAAQPDYNVAPTRTAPVVLERVPRDAPTDAPGGRGERAGRPESEPDDPAAGAADEDGDATADAAVAAAQAAADDAPAEPVRWLRLLRWGLVPSWAKDASVGNRMINARAESLLEKPAYRRAALARRCLVPADGWFEWQPSPTEKDAKGKPRKQPFFMRPVADGPIAFAGVYELWRDPDVHPDDPAAWRATYAVVTTAAEPGLSAIHDRMPLVLPPDRWDDWLDPRQRDPDVVRALLAPPVAGRFVAVPVSARVNAVGNNDAALLEPVPRDQLRGVVDPETNQLLGAAEAPLF
ncbi:MAG TPA: SOS response-associated peptidase [Kineosporiaceae bacterium]